MVSLLQIKERMNGTLPPIPAQALEPAMCATVSGRQNDQHLMSFKDRPTGGIKGMNGMDAVTLKLNPYRKGKAPGKDIQKSAAPLPCRA